MRKAIFNETISLIDVLRIDMGNFINNTDEIKQLSPLNKDKLNDDAEIILSALEDAKNSLLTDKNSSYFLLPFSTALILIGHLDANVNSLINVSNLKSSYAKLRHENDVKQSEKIIVKECWDAWQKEPSQYKNNTKFASAMIDKFRPDNPNDESKHLSSVKVITDWCKDWKREPF